MATVIIGGGPQGALAVSHLLGSGVRRRDEIVLVDPSPILSQWRKRLCATRTEVLRGPIEVEHLDFKLDSFEKFVLANYRLTDCISFPTKMPKPRYFPNVSVFNDHCDFVLAKFAMEPLRLADTVVGMKRLGSLWRLELKSGDFIEADEVILATGPGEPYIPGWAASKCGSRVSHAFNPVEHLTAKTLGIVGTGLTAVSLALHACKHGIKTSIVGRTPLPISLEKRIQKSTFSDVLQLAGLSHEERIERLAMIPFPSFLLPREEQALERYRSAGLLSTRFSEVTELDVTDDDVQVALASGERIIVDQLKLATGFNGDLPKWLRTTLSQADLPFSHEMPELTPASEWGEGTGLFVSGSLAATLLGPYAHGIYAGRRVAESVVKVLSER